MQYLISFNSYFDEYRNGAIEKREILSPLNLVCEMYSTRSNSVCLCSSDAHNSITQLSGLC